MKIYRCLDQHDRTVFATPAANGTFVELAGQSLDALTPTDREVVVKKQLAPIQPTAILCIGLNYRKHAEETNSPFPKWPVLFMKSPGAVQNPSDPIELPRRLASAQVDFEAELAVVIGKRCKNVSAANALDFVLGYANANDVSARDWQKDFGGSQWCRGKTFDTFCPLGPYIATKEEIPNPNALAIQGRLNGETVQNANTDDMIFSVPQIIEFLTGSMTLLPGTVILTGTPSGVGVARNPKVFLKPGDVFEVEIAGLGTLRNPVVAEAGPASGPAA